MHTLHATVPRETTRLPHRRLTSIAAALLAAALLFGGCAAQDVSVRYPTPAEAPAGKITVALNRPVSNVVVTVNDAVAARGEWTDRVVVEGVPAGQAHVVITGGGVDTRPLIATHQVTVKPGGEVVVTAAAPEVTDGAWQYMGLEYLGISIMYAAWVLAVL